jgi:hypothetical protein
MACLPLIERELRVALRKQRPARVRLDYASLAVIGSVLFLLVGDEGRSRSVRGGRSADIPVRSKCRTLDDSDFVQSHMPFE